MIGDRYATLPELKDRLSTNPGGTLNDSRLTAALDAASRGIEDICGRQFNTNGTVDTRLYRPDSLYVCRPDDIAVKTGLIITVNNAVWQENLHYQLYPLNGVRNGVPGSAYDKIKGIQGNNFLPIWSDMANISITAQFGWPSVPTVVHEATLVAAEELSKLKDMPFGIGGYGDFGIVKVRDNPFVCRLLKNVIRYPILAA